LRFFMLFGEQKGEQFYSYLCSFLIP
jgi:hypothetical protein